MRKLSIILSLLLMVACSEQGGVTEFTPPVNGKQIGESWEKIVQNAQPCNLPGCGESSFELFRVTYPQFSLLFVGPKSPEFDPYNAYFHLFREMDGTTTDYNLFVLMGDESSYLDEDLFVHTSENIEILPMDNEIPVADTGLAIPSRQEEIVKTLGYAVRQLPELDFGKTYKIKDLFDFDLPDTPPMQFYFWMETPLGHWKLGAEGETLYLNVRHNQDEGGDLQFFQMEGDKVAKSVWFQFPDSAEEFEILVTEGPEVFVNGEALKLE